MFGRIDPKELNQNVFSMIGEQWMLVTAGTAERCNTMTASWGGLGVLWGKPVATVYIRPQRYTLEFVEREDCFTLSFFGEEYRDALALFPLPVVVASEQGEVLWYNEPFRNQVLDGGELFGDPVETVDGGAGTKELGKKRFFDMEYRGRCYTVYTSTVRVRDTALYVLYYVDNTHLKEIAEEYALSRPAVMMVYIDNVEEVMQDIRDSERAQITGRVETILEDWVGATSGILRKCCLIVSVIGSIIRSKRSSIFIHPCPRFLTHRYGQSLLLRTEILHFLHFAENAAQLSSYSR